MIEPEEISKAVGVWRLVMKKYMEPGAARLLAKRMLEGVDPAELAAIAGEHQDLEPLLTLRGAASLSAAGAEAFTEGIAKALKEVADEFPEFELSPAEQSTAENNALGGLLIGLIARRLADEREAAGD